MQKKKLTIKKPLTARKPPVRRAIPVRSKKNIKSSATTGAAISAPSTTAPKSETGTSWESVASWYDALLTKNDDTYQMRVILPNLLRLMKIAPKESVIDVACGQGFFSAAFAKAGATVTGTDLSESLIGLAREHVPGGTFYVTPAQHAADVGAASIDQAAVVLAIQNIENPRDVFAECARVLKPGGRVHLVMNHPCFRIPKRSSWGWDMNGRQFRHIDGYLTESNATIEMHPGADPTAKTVSFHRPLQYYIKALARTGFVITGFEEWMSHKTSDSGPRAPEENRARKEIPLFLYIEGVKK